MPQVSGLDLALCEKFDLCHRRLIDDFISTRRLGSTPPGSTRPMAGGLGP